MIEVSPILGINLGIEYFEDEDFGRGIILDLLFVRFTFFGDSGD